ncbi:MAG: 50S ribosomal protein L19 [Phycisphaerales bacterium]|nr:50S ribosomal protein L19 [Phycisphaerales bacterium]MCB9854054.1 50S ribosomal protein L19 [Phycisphaerales bacterium]MCB9864364.1 50S ribosomal protein L19 [Phycisphaerales bacterium]
MKNKYIDAIDASNMKPHVPDFEVGDTVSVGVKIVEGNKERIQPFIGVVIGRRGGGMTESFTVRRIVNNEGVERIFPVHSPRIASIEVQRHGKTRRAKLYYLRDRVGKSRKLRERRVFKKKGDAQISGTATASEAHKAEPEPAAV